MRGQPQRGASHRCRGFDRGRRHSAWALDTDEGEHRAVVVRVGVGVEQVPATGGRYRRHELRAPSLTEIEHAFEHPTFSRGPGRVTLLAVNLGAPELLIILVVVLLLFGGAKLPKLARSLGEAQKEFREGTKSADTSTDAADEKKSA